MTADRFRALMGSFSTGVAVITTAWQGDPYGMTVSSLTSVSLDPCMLLICSRAGSATGKAIADRRAFAVNVLGRDQHELSRRFVGRMEERFKRVPVTLHEDLPLIQGCVANAICAVTQIHAAGDHDIIVAAVTECSVAHGEPLILFRGTLGTHAPELQ